MTRNLTRLALKVSVGYAVIAGLWVLLSDRVLELVIKEPASLAFWGTIKGWFFVVVTAALLYAFLRRELRRADLEAEARAEVEEALRRSESRFREVVETINEVFWVFEPGTRQILYISPGFERIWGRKTEELLGSPMLWLDAVSSGLRERVRTAFDRIPHGGRFDEEYTITRPDGEVRWIHDRGFPIRDDAGVLNRIVGVARDITDRKSLERQFLRAQRLESIGTLASGVAHDLNNILAPILMGSSLLKNDASPPEDQKVVDMIEAAAKRGAGIIRQLLTFSRGVEGQRVLVQVRHLMKETGDMLRETLPKNIRIETSAPGNLWPVLADATLMHQVIMNLCVNARDAMPAGGLLSMTAENTTLTAEQVKVGSGAMPGPYVLVTVADTGEGIATESIERIFDPFFTTKEVGRGTGLGLSTALGIVRSHGGFMTVASEPGRGSVFKVHLPAIVAGDAVAGAPARHPCRGAAAS